MARNIHPYDYVMQMIENSTFEDRALLEMFSVENPNSQKSLYQIVRRNTNFGKSKESKIDKQKAYQILIDSVSDYILDYSTSYAAKRRLYNRMLAWCEHMGTQYQIDNYEEALKELPEQISTDIAVEIVKDLHSQDGVSKEELGVRYGASPKTIQVCLHRISDPRCTDPIRIGGQAVHVPISHIEKAPDFAESNKRKWKRKYFTKNTMSPLVFQMNIMQVETLMKSLQLNYDSGNDIPMDLAVDTWGQLSDYARDRIREVFGERDPALMEFLDEVESRMNTDEYRFMTESEILKSGVSYSEQLLIADKGGLVCNISLIGPHRTRKRQRIFYDHERGAYYAVAAEDLSSERLYFTEDEINEIEEA